MAIYYEDANTTVSSNPGTDYLIVRRWGFVEGDKFRKPCEEIVNILSSLKLKKIIFDTAEMRVVTQDDQQWANEEWLPQLFMSGLRYFTYIVPANVLGKMSVEAVSSRLIEDRLEMHYFDNLLDATRWLAQRPA